MIHLKTKTEKYQFNGEKDNSEKLKYHCALKLCLYNEHVAGHGSLYINFCDIKIRYADHENASQNYIPPDYNLVLRDLTTHEMNEIISKIEYPELSKQKAFSLHVGLTIPKLKKILPNYCFDEIVENEYYYNTKTKVIKVIQALEFLNISGHSERNAVRQETYRYEDFQGF